MGQTILSAMKAVTKREFYRTPALVRSLQAGKSVLVTDQGEASFLESLNRQIRG